MSQFLSPPSRASLLRLLASIGLAVILWAWVTTLRDPETSRVFAGVAVTYENLAESLVIVNGVSEAQVRITGPESVVNSVQAGEVQAKLDLAEVTGPGAYTLQIDVDAPNDVWRTAAQPTTVGVTIEQAVDQDFELEVEVQDLDASSLRTVTVEPETEQVVVHGPSSAIEAIDRVVLHLETSGGSRTYQTTLTPVAIDANGESVDDVTITPSPIGATVSVAARGKSVAVLVSTEGSAAPGFEVLDRTANPASVIVDGPAELLDQLIAVSAEPVDISGANSSVSSTVEIIDLPEGVRVIQPQGGEVDVLIQIGQRGVRQALTGLTVTVSNVGDGLEATVNPAEITIEVAASEEVLSELTVDSFRVVVDASGLEAGVHMVEPMVVVPAQVQWISADPASVELSLVEDELTP
jgi:YbbR domain-containing protein